MPPCSLVQLREELRSLYAPTTHAPKTWYIIRQAVDEIERLGVAATDQITVATISRWLEAHDRRASFTNRKLLAALRTVCRYAEFEGYLDRNPFAFRRRWIRSTKTARQRHHSAEAIGRVLFLLESEANLSWENHRLFALVSLYAHTGLRKLEALCLKVEDFDLDQGVVFVVARRRLKTLASEAPVPLPRACVLALESWLPNTGSEWAFPHKHRTGPWTEGRPGQKPLDQVKLAGERAGVKGFTILSLRHSFATHGESLWGLSEGVIKRVLRHTDLRTQLHYRHPDLANLRESVRSVAFPCAGRGEGRQVVEKASLGA